MANTMIFAFSYNLKDTEFNPSVAGTILKEEEFISCESLHLYNLMQYPFHLEPNLIFMDFMFNLRHYLKLFSVITI